LTGAFGLLALGLLAVYGCSSNEKSSSSSTAVGGGAANPANCPTAQPAQGTACTQQGLPCVYGSETCTCNQVPGGFGGRGAGGRGAGGQATALAFACVTTPGAGGAGAGTCVANGTCDPPDSTCVDANGATCTCRNSGTYRCAPGGGGVGSGTGGVAADPNCSAGLSCTAGQTCTNTSGYSCYCNSSNVYAGLGC
jgi:hypothetical protein